MSSFSERMRLRAKASRESSNFTAEKSFVESLQKGPSHFPKPLTSGGILERSHALGNVQPKVGNVLRPLHDNRRPPVPSKPSSGSGKSDQPGKVPLKEIRASDNRLPPRQKVFPSVKSVVVSPPKPGQLYPCLAGMDGATDTEEPSSNVDSPEEEENIQEDFNASNISGTSDSSAENFDIVNMDLSQNRRDSLKRRSDSSSSSNDRKSILKDMDEFLESAFCSDTSFGPSPAKSICNDSLETSISTSFTYQVGSPVKAVTIENTLPTLSHSVSFSRKQNNFIASPPPTSKETITTNSNPPIAEQVEQVDGNTEMTVKSQIEIFESQVKAQENIISQAAGALSVCFSSLEFTNSTQRVEAERLLLLASHKKKAILNEIEKLKSSGTQYLKPIINNSSLTLSDICLPIKLDLIHRAAKANLCHHLVVIVKCNEHVVGTPLFIATKENLLQNSRKIVYVKFPNEITLPNMTPDFKVLVEIYDLVIPVTPASGKSQSSAKRESCKLWITPKKPKPASKLRKVVSRSLLKSSNFKIIGSGFFTLNDVRSSKINLTKMSVPSLLEGTLCFRSSCDVTATVEFRGFLTMFDDISGFGAWHRRWCLLSGNHILFWKYPEDENSKKAIGSIDLSTCVTRNVTAAPRDICARQNTFLMECVRPSRPDDIDSQILTVKGTQTVVRYLLSADTREGRNEWCDNLNQVLSMIHQWKK